MYVFDLHIRMCCTGLQVAVTDVVEAAKDADILVFVLPHQVREGEGGKGWGCTPPKWVLLWLRDLSMSLVCLLCMLPALQFVGGICQKLKGHVKEGAFAISLIKVSWY